MQPNQPGPAPQPTPEQPVSSNEQFQTPVAPGEAAPVVPQGGTQPAPMPQVPQVPPAQDPIAQPGVPAVSSAPQVGPQTAEDVDVIEKEWVDQAEKIIDETKGDPYVEEEAVESLQQDYLMKRYGHQVKKPEDL